MKKRRQKGKQRIYVLDYPKAALRARQKKKPKSPERIVIENYLYGVWEKTLNSDDGTPYLDHAIRTKGELALELLRFWDWVNKRSEGERAEG